MQIDTGSSRKPYYDKMDELNTTLGKKESSYVEIENSVYSILSSLPKLNYDEYYKEISSMSGLATSDNPTTFQLMNLMDKVQQYKSRLSEIMNDVEQEYAVRKRTLEMMYAANDFASIQKSADKRRGEATLRFPNLILQFGKVEAFRTEILNVMNNLKAIGDVASRQASIISMQIQLGEYRKKTSLDFNKDNDAEENNDYKSGVPEIDWGDIE